MHRPYTGAVDMHCHHWPSQYEIAANTLPPHIITIQRNSALHLSIYYCKITIFLKLTSLDLIRNLSSHFHRKKNYRNNKINLLLT